MRHPLCRTDFARRGRIPRVERFHRLGGIMDTRIWPRTSVGVAVIAALLGAPAAADPPGGITQYALPTAASQPGDIAAGPDGNMWFTETTHGLGHVLVGERDRADHLERGFGRSRRVTKAPPACRLMAHDVLG